MSIASSGISTSGTRQPSPASVAPADARLLPARNPLTRGMRQTESTHTSTPPSFLTAEEWLGASLETAESGIVLGSTKNAIIRPLTKNIIEAPEKAFKTTFALRLMLGISSGITVFPELPVMRPRKVLYVHGELSPPEIKERTQAAAQGLPRPLSNFIEGRDLRVHLGQLLGQQALKKIVKETMPEDLVIDPWQAFIPGFDENEFRDVSRATQFMDKLIDEFKVTIYLVTHTGKDHARGTRGHSSLAGWRDTLIKLDRKKGLLEVTVEPRWAAPLKPFNLKFENGTLRSTDETGFGKQADKIRAFLQQQGGESGKKALGEFLKLGDDALRKALQRAQSQNAIVVAGDAIRLPELEAETVEELNQTFGVQ